MMMDCLFCFERPPNRHLGNRVLHSTESFLVYPGLGQLVEGYLLIVTRDHHTSMGEMPPERFGELVALKEEVRRVLSKRYRNPIFLEHGGTSIEPEDRCGSCIDHAHLHAFPVEVDLLPRISRDLEAKPETITHMSDLRHYFESRTGYLFYESKGGEMYVFRPRKMLQGQYLRRILSEELKMPDKWNWRTNPEEEKFQSTLRALSDWDSIGLQKGYERDLR